MGVRVSLGECMLGIGVHGWRFRVWRLVFLDLVYTTLC